MQASSKQNKRPAAASGPKVLRACVLQQGRVVDESRLGPKESVTIGTQAKNTFALPGSKLPQSHLLFSAKSGSYELIVTEQMTGRVSVDGAEAVDFKSLRAQGLIKKQGNQYHLPLTPKHRGKVTCDDVTIIFQFVVPPPVPPKPKLPAAAKGTLMQQVNWPYLGILIASAVLHSSFLVAAAFAPPPPKVAFAKQKSRFVKQFVAPEKKEEKKPEPKKEDKKVDPTKKKDKGPKKPEPKPEPEPEPEPVERPAPRTKAEVKKAAAQKAATREAVGQSAVVSGLRSLTAEGGAMAAVLDGNVDEEMGAQFDAAKASGLHSTSASGKRGLSARDGGGPIKGGVGKVGKKAGGKATKATKKRRRISARAGSLSVDSGGSLSSKDISRVVKKNSRAANSCYDAELKKDPSLSGKVTVEVTIGPNGKVIEVMTSSSGKMKGVANCIKRRVKRWRFPKGEDETTVEFPFIFTSQ